MRYEIRTEEDHIGQITMQSIKFIDQFKDISYNLVLKCNNYLFFPIISYISKQLLENNKLYIQTKIQAPNFKV